MNEKKFQDMTEEEILDHAATGIREYVAQIRRLHSKFVLQECLNRQEDALKMLFRQSRGLGRWDAMSPRDIREMDLTVNHFMPRMQEQATAVQLQYMKEHITWKIRGTSANALIRNAFLEIGMKAVIECQRYRAKVIVDLGGHKLRFYVGFKALEKEDTMPNVTRAVLDLKDAACRIGGDIKLGRKV